MVFIRDIVRDAFKTGYLSVEAEKQLRQLLKSDYNSEDLEAFMKLQQAAITGRIQQESRQQKAKVNLKSAYQTIAILTAAVIALSLPKNASAGTLTNSSTTAVNGRVSSTNAVSPELARKLQTNLDRAVRETGIPGATSYIVSPQGTWFGASGVSNLATKEPMQSDKIFAIGSATKAFTVATLLKLQEEGKLNLDDPLGQWLPEIAAQIPEGNSITIRQLLNGSAGVYNYTGDERFLAEVFANPQRNWHPEELVAYVYGKPRFQGDQCTPKWCYPNTGMVLAGMVAEKATGASFSSLLRHQILNPLGLNYTFLGGDEPIVDNLARGYQDIFKADRSPGQDGIPDDLTDVNRSAFWANGALFSNAQDQAEFSKALFEGKLLQSQSLQEMLTFVDTGLGDWKYGLGTFERSTPWGRVLGHGGDDVGYQAGRFYFPDRDITVVYLINQQYEIENSEKDAVTPVFSAIMTPLVAQWQGNNPKSVPEHSGVIGLVAIGATGLLLKCNLPRG